ncbi:2-dehydro-3-deoxygalactonokinase [soil metagenome]
MKHFISCDWGTSSFRLRLVNAETQVVVAETKSPQGIAATDALWKEQSDTDRISFYSNIILRQIVLLEEQCGYSLNDITIIISGMASATIGMIELPYKSIPFPVSKAEFVTYIISKTEICMHTMIIISGVRSDDDVMRGEETILAGCNIKDDNEKRLFIFPGTHSKHVVVQNGIIQNIKTFMTGELFELLSSKSILATSVEKDSTSDESNAAFIKGVKEAVDSNFLNSIFHVRTNSLFEKLDRKNNYHYLSGLLIGEELKNIQAEDYVFVTIVSTGALQALYTEALLALGFKEKLIQQNAEEALIKGQVSIFDQYQ